MTWVISKRQLLLIFSYVVFIARTLAEPPEAVQREFIAHRRQQREMFSVKTSSDHPVDYNQNWAGAAQLSLPSGTVNSVSAQWTFPTASLSSSTNESGVWFLAQAVGIDGYSTCPTTYLLAGTYTFVQVSTSGEVTTGAFAFYEWWPNNSTVLSAHEFSAAPGDTVEFSITLTNNSEARLVVTNLSTEESTNTTMNAPGLSSNLCGLSAEWILNNPSASDGSAVYTIVKDFSFHNCAATTTTGATVDLNNATLLIMAEDGNDILATASAVNATELTFSYG